MEIDTQKKPPESELQEIVEGKATIKTGGKVFYNIVQEFNRDLRYLSNNFTSVSVFDLIRIQYFSYNNFYKKM